MKTNKPNFLGIGVHKAGTSWLYQQLVDHSEVYMPPKKEIHFFDRSLRYLSPNMLAESSPFLRPFKLSSRDLGDAARDVARIVKHTLTGDFEKAAWYRKWVFGYYNEDWYASLFQPAEDYKAYGEISPAYSLLDVQDVARIKAFNPDMKLILMLRDPIARAWSNVRYGAGRGLIAADLASPDEIISALKQPDVDLRGDYERTLEAYLEVFDSSQLLVCFYEAIEYDPMGLMAGVTNFLGLTPFAEEAVDYKRRVNASKPQKMPRIVKDYLLETYGPRVESVAAMVGSYANLWQGANESVKAPLDMKLLGIHNDPKMVPTLHL
ncbi:MAG: sulfotransferase [Cyanobacteria bacterium J06621_11]